MMGLQNAVITKISHAEIRTTHITGLVTDLGIELGKLLYVNRSKTTTQGQPNVRANRQRLRLQALLITCFFCGGLVGALGFKGWGYITTLPLALLLWTLALRPIIDDVKVAWQR